MTRKKTRRSEPQPAAAREPDDDRASPADENSELRSQLADLKKQLRVQAKELKSSQAAVKKANTAMKSRHVRARGHEQKEDDRAASPDALVRGPHARNAHFEAAAGVHLFGAARAEDEAVPDVRDLEERGLYADGGGFPTVDHGRTGERIILPPRGRARQAFSAQRHRNGGQAIPPGLGTAAIQILQASASDGGRGRRGGRGGRGRGKQIGGRGPPPEKTDNPALAKYPEIHAQQQSFYAAGAGGQGYRAPPAGPGAGSFAVPAFGLPFGVPLAAPAPVLFAPAPPRPPLVHAGAQLLPPHMVFQGMHGFDDADPPEFGQGW